METSDLTGLKKCFCSVAPVPVPAGAPVFYKRVIWLKIKRHPVNKKVHMCFISCSWMNIITIFMFHFSFSFFFTV